MAQILLSDAFLPSTAGFSNADVAKVVAFVVGFRENPKHPSFSLERVTGAKSPDVWSARITQEKRAILYKDGDTWVALHAGKHDEAYRWAEVRDIGRHAVTGALQVVEIVEEAKIPRALPQAPTTEKAPTQPPLFQSHDDAYLLSLGAPQNWLPVLRKIRNDDQLLDVVTKLPADVAERLVRVAQGELVTPPAPIPANQPIAASPDALQHYYVVDDQSDLKAVLEAPLQKWIAFLHPSQRKIVEARFNGPAKVTGSAGTGKTTVALHRARYLARQGKRVLVTTYVTTLAENLLRNLKQFCTTAELERITVSSVHSRALAISKQRDSTVHPAQAADLKATLELMRLRHGAGFAPEFIRAEWEGVIQLQGLLSWNEYRTARRVGRGKALSVTERKALWGVFGAALEDLAGRHKYDWPFLCRYAELALKEGKAKSEFDAVLVDEVQDLKPPEIRFLKALAPDGLVVFGDAGQRIYPGGFSLGALGVDVKGRSHVLRLNYRTTEQIRRAADLVLGDSADDLDAGAEARGGTRSLLRGPAPFLEAKDAWELEVAAAVSRIQAWIARGIPADSIAVFSRAKKRLEEIVKALRSAGLPVAALKDGADQEGEGVLVGTMHRAKGLEFRAVLLMDCADGSLPSNTALENCADPADRQETFDRERRILYVAMTRARDELALSWSGPPSPFLERLIQSQGAQNA